MHANARPNPTPNPTSEPASTESAEAAFLRALRRIGTTPEAQQEGVLFNELKAVLPEMEDGLLRFYVERHRRRGILATTRMSPEDDEHEGELLVVYLG